MLASPRVWINGSETSFLNVFDRGLSYGDGFFTTALVRNGAWLNGSAHLWRLQQSTEKLHFPALDSADLLKQICASYAQLGELNTHSLVLKIMVTRGVGGRGYQPPEPSQPTLIIQWSAAPSDLNATPPLTLWECQTPLSLNTATAGIKHLNRLDNVLAKNELAHLGFSDGLMCNARQDVICSSQANLFLLRGDELTTPLLHESGVHGTVRYALEQLSVQLGYRWREQPVQWAQVLEADGLFLSNAIRGIVPVAALHMADQSEHHFASESLLDIARIGAYFDDYQSATAISLVNEIGR
ncbi:aminodeoxychorismate lyase [Thiosulfatimonas sediminis]|uniref:Aminodeoxychorismate lyase n=1 Tax=Thiosulfatimonas sediminis TaxID=2675054 RepID=A0A6F8PVV5_9GAMM|nr:aminodeoxychorismate lyase [Thiosulfatimonas sediminis]BBP46261.1 aminodeoxychorismate lyase [Thiosulfatimonas sediminis]